MPLTVSAINIDKVRNANDKVRNTNAFSFQWRRVGGVYVLQIAKEMRGGRITRVVFD